MSQDILFNKRKLKSLLKQGYEYITFDDVVAAWKEKPEFVPEGTYGMSQYEKELVNKGIWCSNGVIEYIELSEIDKIAEARIHIYSIQKLLEVIPNCEQI